MSTSQEVDEQCLYAPPSWQQSPSAEYTGHRIRGGLFSGDEQRPIAEGAASTLSSCVRWSDLIQR
jgi:hypothetical protein